MLQPPTRPHCVASPKRPGWCFFAFGFFLLHSELLAQVAQPFTRPLEAANPSLRARFGDALAVGNQVLVVGAPGDSLRGPEAGAVHVFDRRPAGDYVPSAVLQPTLVSPFDRFGDALSLFGNVLVVGARGDDTAAPNAGAAYVFTRVGAGQPFQPVAKLLPPAPWAEANGAFGESVAVLGGRIAVGAPRTTGTAYQSGAVFVYDVDPVAGTVGLDAVVLDPGARVGDGLGCAVAIAGDRMFAGAERYDVPGGLVNAGAVLVFLRSGTGSWTLSETLVSSSPRNGAEFGRSVALEPPRALFPGSLVVGEPGAAPAGQSTLRGAVHVFQAFVGTPWTRVFSHGFDDVRANTERGASVAVQSGFAFASAPARDQGRGGVDVLTRVGGTWSFSHEVSLPDSLTGDRAGTGLAFFNEVPVLGAPGRDGAAGLDVGWAWTSSTLWADVGDVQCAPAVVNSTGAFASLVASGSTRAASNDLTLHGGHLPPFNFVLPLVATGPAFVPAAGGSRGTLCLGGALGRFTQSITMVDVAGRVAIDVDLGVLPQPSGPVVARSGETWWFQLWYRDFDPTLTSNYTSSIRVAFE